MISPFSPWTPSGHEDTQYGPSCKCAHATHSSAPCRKNEMGRLFNKSNNLCKQWKTFYQTTIDYRSCAGVFAVLHRTLLVTQQTLSFRSGKLSFFTVESRRDHSEVWKSLIVLAVLNHGMLFPLLLQHTLKTAALTGCVSVHSLKFTA